MINFPDDVLWPVEVEEPAPRTLLVKVRGDLDDPVLHRLRVTLDEELADARFSRVVLDLSRVTLLPPAAVELLRRLRDAQRAAMAEPATVNPREQYANWVAPLCWLAVALEGFDLVVLGVVLPALLDTRPTGPAGLRGRPTAVARPERPRDGVATHGPLPR